MPETEISAQELHALLDTDMSDSIVVDVRTPEEFAKGAIVGAKNIPVDQIFANIDALRPYRKIYLYCLSGGRSQIALATLVSAKLDAELYSLTSGILAWRGAGYLLV